jgi:hypothetical protein
MSYLFAGLLLVLVFLVLTVPARSLAAPNAAAPV